MLPGDFLILGLIIGAVFIYYITKFWQSQRARKRVLRAGKAESAARKFLETRGYSILAVQERVPIVTKVNGKPHKSHIKADLIVQKGKQVFVVDVKTGDVALKPASPDNRRQLLEYYLVYRTDGVLILDMDNERLYTLEFDIKFPTTRGFAPLPYLLCFLAGAIVVFILFYKGGAIS
ncbi:hypothetical protein [Desulforamulus ferrireducens]|uniref:PD-(D/E)XK endonuclease-like domain-containing protein n=1 Tax=Desulforamulus ferrireducens TaxID=1833852 RepID=A0A1S6IUR7_9FIRM|nr:hypothetical protein [Desulforamulus ferrireducens]AQS58516.1 hypothetical protein B0537_05090 [Desulforamulus ferrireducens]